MMSIRTFALTALGLIVACPSWAEDKPVLLAVSEGRLLLLPAPAATVFVADPTIADVQVPTPNRVFLIGRKPGRTNLYALRPDGERVVSMSVTVEGPTEAATKSLSSHPGSTQLQVEGSEAGLTVKGKAADPASANTAVREVKSVARDAKVEDQTTVASSAQVSLKVRIAEVSRTVTKDLGINWTAAVNNVGNFAFGLVTPYASAFPGTGYSSLFKTSSGSFSIDTVIDALATEGLISVLAEPNLTATSGEVASFLAGGEFPIPIAQNSGANGTTVTVTYKQYGVSLDFVPTVMAANHISLRVRPEVSELTTAGEVESNGITIPALTVRRADTTVELGSGQSFVIAGLLLNRANTLNNRLPGLGDLPILGALFRSTHFQRDESELLIIVTPTIVEPINDPKTVKLPMDGTRAPNDFEQLLLNAVAVRAPLPGASALNASPSLPHLAGDAGFELN